MKRQPRPLHRHPERRKRRIERKLCRWFYVAPETPGMVAFCEFLRAVDNAILESLNLYLRLTP